MGHSLSRRWSLTKSCDYRKYGKNRKTDTSISNVAQHEGQRRGNRAGVYFFPWIFYIRQGFFSLPWGFLILLRIWNSGAISRLYWEDKSAISKKISATWQRSNICVVFFEIADLVCGCCVLTPPVWVCICGGDYLCGGGAFHVCGL